MADKFLSCLLTDTASARFMLPVIKHWLSEEYPILKRLYLSEEASVILTTLNQTPEVHIIDRYQPHPVTTKSKDIGSVVISSAGGWPIEHATKLAAIKSKTIVIQLIETWYGYRKRLTANDAWNLPNILMLVDQIAAREAISEGIPKEIQRIVGNPAWEQIKPGTCDIKNTLFIGAPVQKGYGSILGYDEVSAWSLVLKTANSFPHLFGELFYAPHPEQSLPRNLGKAKLTKYRPDKIELFDNYIGMFSAPLVEAFLAERRTISIQPNHTSLDMCPLSRHGYIRRVSSSDELIRALKGSFMSCNKLRKSLQNSKKRVIETIHEAFLGE